MDNKPSIFSTQLFQPLGVDDLVEADTAEFIEPLPGFSRALKEEANAEIDDNIKEEDETLMTVYKDEPAALNTLRHSLDGHAPWLEKSIPYPLVLRTDYSPKNMMFDYEPKIFYYPERTYRDWIELDGAQHLFIWNKETSEICSEASEYHSTETWYCHCSGKPASFHGTYNSATTRIKMYIFRFIPCRLLHNGFP
jgi:hypothetical protein